jgi:hypothetical protein
VLVSLIILLLFAAAGLGGWWGYRLYVTGDAGAPWSNWFGPRPIPRLKVSEQASVDARRRLVLVRRDDVEHLIMTGGPVDIVIETGIAAPTPRAEAPGLAPPVFSRPARTFGQAVNE